MSDTKEKKANIPGTDVFLKMRCIKTKASPFMDSVSDIRGKLRAARTPPLRCDNTLCPCPCTLNNLNMAATGAFCGFFSKHPISVITNGNDT